MQTSNFRISGKDKRAVAISLGVPAWYHGCRCLALAPAPGLIKMRDEKYFRILYGRHLDLLDAKGGEGS